MTLGWVGPDRPRIVILGEAWGEQEAMCRQPFVGSSGQELWRMLGDAWPDLAPELHSKATAGMRYGNAWIGQRAEWMAAASVAFTNVFNLRPDNNQIESLCETKKENKSVRPEHQIMRSHYLRSEHLPQLDRLRQELAAAKPNLVIAAGNTASWALIGSGAIGSIRGTVSVISSGQLAGLKVLPTYHPAAILRQWSWRPIVVADLMKARREGTSSSLVRPRRQVLVNPSISDLHQWIEQAALSSPRVMGVDIETAGGGITCIGFAISKNWAVVIPFAGGKDGNYWTTVGEELEAWQCVQRLLLLDCDKVFQNGMYDLQYICKMGLRVSRVMEDTMLLHHSLYPELQKGLGFLGSIYTNEASWKLMNRKKKKDEMTKKDE